MGIIFIALESEMTEDGLQPFKKCACLNPIIGDVLAYMYTWRKFQATNKVKCYSMIYYKFYATTECRKGEEVSDSKERNPRTLFTKQG